MNYYIGIDLGTSGLKAIVTDNKGSIIAQTTKEYLVSYPKDGWSEQNPNDWLKAMEDAIIEITKGISKDVKAISFGGQMHGLVILDDKDNVIRPCILWNDGRTQKETDYLNDVIGKKELSKMTANIAFAGFTAPKILWVKNNEPENFKKIKKIMLPKDYLAYYLSGVHASDYSDASGMFLLDVEHKCWSNKMCEICDIKLEQLPKLFESYESIGLIKKDLAVKLGLNEDVKIVIGAGDNAAAAIGTGTINNGDCNISLGTSGTIFISQDSFSVDKTNALHSFAHSNGYWHLMGCILSAASCNKWWIETVLNSKDYQMVDNCTLGDNNVYFLPYLMGERSPHNDTYAKGCFIGLRPDTTKEQMALAVMEGVTFALRDCIDIARENGIKIDTSNLCGGGAKSKTWRKIIANVLDVKVKMTSTEQGPSFGGAILAMVGNGEYKSVKDAVDNIVKYETVEVVDDILKEKYNQKYHIWKNIYPALKEVFKKL